ncbi:MAG: flagellar biosynthesis protein FlhB [Pirellulales bacterium]
MAEQSGDKSHDATPYRRQQAREQGQVAYSQDLGSAVLLLVALLIIMMQGPDAVRFLIALMRRQLGGDAVLATNRDAIVVQWNGLLAGLTQVLLPFFGMVLVAAVLCSVLQIGFLFVPQRVSPDLARISPLKGLGRLFSLTSAVRLGFGLFKVAVIAAVVAACLYDRWEAILATAAMRPVQIAVFLAELTVWTCLKIAMALVVLALLDYGYQRWKHQRDLRMTTQEVREEMRNLHGDPQILARRRAVQRQLALHRLSDTVPKADVVVTNPTELAVAIQYVPDKMAAPIVLAKGAGVLAQRIRRLALENNVPIVEKKPLAQALYRDVEVNRPIPDTLYGAVAEVLAYVYQLKGKRMPGGSQAA